MLILISIHPIRKPPLSGAATLDAEAGTHQGGQAGAQGAAGMAERALRQMMGGTLAGKEDTRDPFQLDKPEWMEGNPKHFNEEQLKVRTRLHVTQGACLCSLRLRTHPSCLLLFPQPV
jgi:hypothetical protein